MTLVRFALAVAAIAVFSPRTARADYICVSGAMSSQAVDRDLSRTNLSAGVQFDVDGPMDGSHTRMIGGLGVDARWYGRPGILAGLRGVLGSVTVYGDTKQHLGRAQVAAPILAFHRTSQAFTTYDGCGTHNRWRRFLTHVFGVEPYVSHGDGTRLGGHLVYELDWYRRGRRDGDDRRRWIDRRIVVGLRAGWIDTLGAGGSVELAAEAVFVRISAIAGMYSGSGERHGSLQIGLSVPIW